MSALSDAKPATRRPRCSVGKARQHFADTDPDSLGTLDEWLTGTAMSDRRIYEALTKSGLTVSWQTIGRHRRGECSCGKGAS